MKAVRHLFTSESVAIGHPDKIADQISDAILDAMIAQDPYSRVAIETLVTTGIAIIAGEVTTSGYVEIPDVARETIKDIGYTDASMGFDFETCAILTSIHAQSADISQGVTEGQGLHKEMGAGDQGMMFGYACRETPELMPLPIMLAHRIMQRLRQVRVDKEIPYLRPDGKCQVTVEYENDHPVRIHTVVLSAQHHPDVDYMKIHEDLIRRVVKQVLPPEMVDKKTIYHINPTGRFAIGGPQGDTGVTGRKIIVDTYGGRGSHGGGAFSGKDPSKVDRSASYMARYIAKNIVAAELAERCEVQLAYAIGVANPVAVLVNTEGTAEVPEERIGELVREHFPLTPKGMIEHLRLLRPIYRRTAYFGHFGRNDPDFTWEQTDKAADLKDAAGL